MGKVKYKALNCKKAIETYQNALEILTEELYPMYKEITADNLESY
ncbi:hypothetical protein RG963_13070 [Methanosarcina sp. Z-7115]|uniref:Uncharacterized protein n=1 Tax=Methanosarcina baikalica TaxID=3073890 RepID=A0ABU2D432_9EURY|nr:hypothetical protein [Methanosarcina sp. Z-7115]MDR7666692.1 hypothetical protein [Methanosarcina sp. Z-7115]